ncbi:hypothetical protein LOC68_12895 [Blastopirellula sp. JC732]|uniref:Leucine-rich repeat domain-containing protein n=1 Tax=Blastopirellula sediminis TaxID=2894196 RepID=A0A9X1SK25_9BACT|nr:hypothetical protein [Blastopirellula sediminis]MCC9607413.1 hypothetical protein [Blastopirellula sediminis]MCC9629294.1 hypothetical protein [Blastopirellula sediminis]
MLTFAFTPLWRWKWLFLSLLIATVAYGIWSVEYTHTYKESGTIIASQAYRDTLWRQMSHGWPIYYGHRSFAAAETASKRWTIWSDWDMFYWGCLAADLAIAVVLSALLTYLVAWRFSLSGRWQFGLRDVLAATIVIAVPLGIVRSFENAYRADQNYLAGLRSYGFEWGKPWEEMAWYQRPWQDLGLLSPAATSPQRLAFHSPPAAVENSSPANANFDLNQFLSAEVATGGRLQRPLSRFTLRNANLSDEGVVALTRWAPRNERLFLIGDNQFSDAAVATLVDAWPSLIWLTFGSEKLTRESIPALRRLKRLDSLDFTNCSHDLDFADLEPLAELPDLAVIRVPQRLFETLTPEEAEAWRRRGVVIRASAYEFEESDETESP